VTLVLGFERMIVGVEGDLSLVALLLWCSFSAPGEGGGGGIYGLHARGGQRVREPRMAHL
jgi:hypothetical protein